MAEKLTGAEALKKDAEEQTKDAEEMAGERGDESPRTEPKRDWVEEAWKCFIKDAADIDPTDPVRAIEVYFEKNATDELKARCKAEGKDAKGCWKFVEAVARKALHGSSGHIDPAAVYAIAMHWFEDVPKDWENRGKAATPVRTPSVIRKEKERQAKAKKPKPKAEKPVPAGYEGNQTLAEAARRGIAKINAKKKAKKPKQGFFFEMLESPTPEATETRNAEQESEVQK